MAPKEVIYLPYLLIISHLAMFAAFNKDLFTEEFQVTLMRVKKQIIQKQLKETSTTKRSNAQ